MRVASDAWTSSFMKVKDKLRYLWPAFAHESEALKAGQTLHGSGALRGTARAAAFAAPILFAAGFSLAQQAPAGDVAEGRRLAEPLCGPCHVVASNQIAEPVLKPALKPPSFASIMQKPAVDAAYLRAFITVEHVKSKSPVVMPNLELTDSERDAIVSYMLSLHQHQ